MTVRSHLALGLAAVAMASPHPVLANLLQERSQRFHPVESSAGIVAAQEAQAAAVGAQILREGGNACLLYTSPSPRDGLLSRMPSSA